ncbi:MAG: FAD-binding oxidoreductase [Phycisphaerales bacterium]|nr:MAG: FAD-binding oxidoreductase [Phycisphaerales bacterium]
MGASLWQTRLDGDEASWDGAAARAGGGVVADARVDAVVIGAGVVGLSAAIELESRGVRTLVLERGRAACGASGRNAGYLMRGAADNYFGASEIWGREGARHVWRWSEDNLRALRALGIERLPGYAARLSALVAIDADECEALERSCEMMCEDGFEAELVRTGEDALWRAGCARVALVNPRDACCDPIEVMSWLAGMLREPVVEGVRVRACVRTGDAVRVETDRGVVEAGIAIVATNALAAELVPQLAGVVEACRGQMAAYRAPNADLAMSYYLNHGGEYVRTGTDGLLLAGGMRRFHEASERTVSNEPTPALQGDLDAFVRETFDVGALEVVARWAGTMGFTPSGLPVLGVLGGDGEGRLGVAAGFTGHGMSLGHLAGREVASAAWEGRTVRLASCPSGAMALRGSA